MTRSNWKLCGLTLAIAAGLLAACGIPTATPEQCPREDFPYVTLQSPENGVTVNSLTPLFEWENSQGSCEPQEFSIDLALDSTFAVVILSDTTDGPYPGWTSTIELLDCTTYFWRVAPIVDGVRGEYSETHEFNVDVSGACNADASISGDIFHDLCAVPYASIPPGDPLPEGCIDAGPVEGLEANGVYEPGEPGIEAITLHLGNGACPSSGLATAGIAGSVARILTRSARATPDSSPAIRSTRYGAYACSGRCRTDTYISYCRSLRQSRASPTTPTTVINSPRKS